MSYSHGNSRRDANHAEMVKAARDLGAYVMDCANDRNGYDFIAILNGEVTFCEVKTSYCEKLTGKEEAARVEILFAGGRYAVVTNEQDLREAIR